MTTSANTNCTDDNGTTPRLTKACCQSSSSENKKVHPVTISEKEETSKLKKEQQQLRDTTTTKTGGSFKPARLTYRQFSPDFSTEEQHKRELLSRRILPRDSPFLFRPSRTKFRRFSLDLSTEEQHQSTEMVPDASVDGYDDDNDNECKNNNEDFSDGPYAHIRKALDYNYHSHYRKERQWLQDSIINELLSNSEGGGGDDRKEDVLDDDETNDNYDGHLWFLCMVGTDPNATDKAKNSWMRLIHEGKLPVMNLRKNKLLHLDPQEIRRRLPEFFSYCQKLSPSSSMRSIKDIVCPASSYRYNAKVEKLTRKETEYILEIIVRAALESGTNVMLDYTGTAINGNGNCDDWLYSILDLLQSHNNNNCPFKLGLIHANPKALPPLQEEQKSAITTKRNSARTNRDVRCEKIDSIKARTPKETMIQKLKSKVDYCCELVGNDDDDDDDAVDVANELCFLSSRPKTQRKELPLSPKEEKDGKQKQKQKSNSFVTAADDMKVFLKLYMKKIWKKKRSNTTNYDKCFQPRLSSEQNYQASSSAEEKSDLLFHGLFASIRETLDYSFHQHYTKQRQMLQDNIIRHLLNAPIINDKDGNVCTTPTKPWIVFTAGVMGAGKSYTMKKLVSKGRFPMMAFVAVDPDEIRRYLPEYSIYIEENPEMAGELTNKESGLIAEILTLAALRSGKNVLVDGSLRDFRWYQRYFQRLRDDFPILRQAIIHVSAPREAVFERAASRAISTGRVVPRKLLEEALEQVPKAVQILSPIVDYVSEVHNAAGSDDVDLVKGGKAWGDFQRQWIQTCSIDSMRKSNEINPQNFLPVATYAIVKGRVLSL